ncbi:hypothetical protein, partial [Acrocarpospora corrugata]|uniref:hypothetical protein n=1 Tax=Acrocarpospora corrugata TaxID=35763 RepID=UPI003CD0AB83
HLRVHHGCRRRVHDQRRATTPCRKLLTVRSYLDSARKHGLSGFEAIHRVFTGDLWMPPVALDA